MLAALVILRLAVAGAFALAALGKIIRPDPFYSTLRLSGLPPAWAGRVGALVPACELALATLIVAPSAALIGPAMAIAAMMFFGFAGWMVWVMKGGVALRCSCFGGRGSVIGAVSLMRNLALVAVCIAGMWISTVEPPLAPLSTSASAIATATVLVVALLVTQFRSRAAPWTERQPSWWLDFNIVPLPAQRGGPVTLAFGEVRRFERIAAKCAQFHRFLVELRGQFPALDAVPTSITAFVAPGFRERVAVHLRLGDDTAGFTVWFDRGSAAIVNTVGRATIAQADGVLVLVEVDGEPTVRELVTLPRDHEAALSAQRADSATYWRCALACFRAAGIAEPWLAAAERVCGYCAAGPFCTACWTSLLGDAAMVAAGCADCCA